MFDPTPQTITAPSRADPFALETLIAWLRTKDPEKSYTYADSRNCLLCQYFASQGFLNPRVNPWRMSSENEDYQRHYYLPLNFDGISVGDTYHYTFGAALQRALAL